MAKVVLYTQPSDVNPKLVWKDLEQGIYKLWTVFPPTTEILFTNMGQGVWETAKALDSDASIIGLSKPPFKNALWTVQIKTNHLNILLKHSQYKKIIPSFFDSREGMLQSMVKGIFISLEFEGDRTTITSFIQKFVSRFNGIPCEISDWNAFNQFTGLSREQVISAWEEYADYQSKKIFCTRCGNKIDADASFCPKCGAKIG
jgi:ribosomal protein L40E